jgi:hypothetical protein
MYAVRRWSVRHAGLLEIIYDRFERLIVKLHPVWQRIGYARLEKPFALSERAIKGFLFDCQMCGQCMLRATGMACPLNCPKNLVNGPCGGVKPDGNCEIKPDMRCVWVEAWEGSQRMRNTVAIQSIQKPLNFRIDGSSSWLRVARQRVTSHDNSTEVRP